MNPRNGDVIRMTSFTHVEPHCRWGIKVGDKTKVAVFMLLGEENKDGTEPLDLEKRLNDLGWASANSDAFSAMLVALRAVQGIISEAAMTGFNCKDGDWAERLFHSQQATSAAIKKASPVSSPDREAPP